jgi:hypothetical protein
VDPDAKGAVVPGASQDSQADGGDAPVTGAIVPRTEGVLPVAGVTGVEDFHEELTPTHKAVGHEEIRNTLKDLGTLQEVEAKELDFQIVAYELAAKLGIIDFDDIDTTADSEDGGDGGDGSEVGSLKEFGLIKGI